MESERLRAGVFLRGSGFEKRLPDVDLAACFVGMGGEKQGRQREENCQFVGMAAKAVEDH